MINGRAHGPQKATATCQLHMREFQDGDEIVVEPFRAAIAICGLVGIKGERKTSQLT